MDGREREGEGGGFDWTQSQVMIIAFLSRMQRINGDALQSERSRLQGELYVLALAVLIYLLPHAPHNIYD